jgi:hypothetical protein
LGFSLSKWHEKWRMIGGLSHICPNKFIGKCVCFTGLIELGNC